MESNYKELLQPKFLTEGWVDMLDMFWPTTSSTSDNLMLILGNNLVQSLYVLNSVLLHCHCTVALYCLFSQL